MYLIKITIKFLLIFIFLNSLAWGHHVPSPPENKLLLRGHLRYFHKANDWLYQAEANHTSQIDHRVTREYQAGFKYRLHKNIKTEFHLARRYGQRHDDDWIWRNHQWQWVNSDNRGENFLLLGISPRVAFNKFVAEFRIRNEFNFFNDQDTLRLRPGITYFWFEEGKPFINFFLQYEAFVPLNYDVGEHSIREHWIWGGALYHLHKNLKVGAYLSYRDMLWGPSQDFINREGPNESFDVNEPAWEIGLILNIHTFN